MAHVKGHLFVTFHLLNELVNEIVLTQIPNAKQKLESSPAQLSYLPSCFEQVAELSESTCPGVQEAIHSVVHGLLATLSPKIHSKAPPPQDNTSGSVLNLGGEDDDRAELVENASLPFQPLISVPRDYLARLLFW